VTEGGRGGAPQVEGEAVETKSPSLSVGDQLHIEEKRSLLQRERDLSVIHKALARQMRELEAEGLQDAADALGASTWALGVAILQVTRRLQR